MYYCDTNDTRRARRFCSDNMVPVEPPGDTLVAGCSGASRKYCSCTRVPVVPSEDTVKALGTRVANR